MCSKMFTHEKLFLLKFIIILISENSSKRQTSVNNIENRDIKRPLSHIEQSIELKH